MKKYLLLLLIVCPLYGATVSDDFNRADQNLFNSANWSADYLTTASLAISLMHLIKMSRLKSCHSETRTVCT